MEIFKIFYSFVELFFIIYLAGYSTFLLISILVGAVSLFSQKERETLYNYIEHDFYVPISIIVPAHNEEITIIDTITSLLALDYRLYEIIIVDDGSSDNTSEKIINYFELEKINRPIRKKISCKQEKGVYTSYKHKVPITLVIKESGGKADSLNMGINISEYPYFICMDADSMLQDDALINIVRPVLEQNDVVAVGGLVRIVNDVIVENGKVVDYKMPKSILLSMQVLEYDRTFLASRLFFDKFNGNLIISGAFGLFKKDIIIPLGGYNTDTMGEDMELVVRVHAFCRANKIPYSIKYATSAICWSQAPSTLSDLLKQRKRWHIGLFQSIAAHRNLLFNADYGLISYISFIYFIVYELLSPYIEVFGVITVLLASYFNILNVESMLIFLLIYVLFSGLMSITAFISRMYSARYTIKKRDVLKALLICLIENVGLRSILCLTRMFALVGYKKNKLKWDKIQRTQNNIRLD